MALSDKQGYIKPAMARLLAQVGVSSTVFAKSRFLPLIVVMLVVLFPISGAGVTLKDMFDPNGLMPIDEVIEKNTNILSRIQSFQIGKYSDKKLFENDFMHPRWPYLGIIGPLAIHGNSKESTFTLGIIVPPIGTPDAEDDRFFQWAKDGYFDNKTTTHYEISSIADSISVDSDGWSVGAKISEYYKEMVVCTLVFRNRILSHVNCSEDEWRHALKENTSSR